jgi:Fe-S-cluster formation regulator IscX/YfhJ
MTSDFLKQYANENRLPIMDTIQFDRWTEELGKEKFRELLAEYIEKYRPVFPLKNISYEDMRKNIIDLSKFDTSKNRLKRKYLKNMMIMNMVLTSTV